MKTLVKHPQTSVVHPCKRGVTVVRFNEVVGERCGALRLSGVLRELTKVASVRSTHRVTLGLRPIFRLGGIRRLLRRASSTITLDKEFNTPSFNNTKGYSKRLHETRTNNYLAANRLLSITSALEAVHAIGR